jgi:hypothetical protein
MPAPAFLGLGAGDVLAAMITPAVLISASGTLVLSTSNRLGRVVDRIRNLTDLAEEIPEGTATDQIVEKRSLIANQIGWLTRRLSLLQWTIITLYIAIGFLVASSLTVGLSAVAQGAMDWLSVGFGLLGALALMVGAGMLVQEARLAVRGTLNELNHVRKVVARKTTMPVVLAKKPEGDRGAG